MAYFNLEQLEAYLHRSSHLFFHLFVVKWIAIIWISPPSCCNPALVVCPRSCFCVSSCLITLVSCCLAVRPGTGPLVAGTKATIKGAGGARSMGQVRCAWPATLLGTELVLDWVTATDSTHLTIFIGQNWETLPSGHAVAELRTAGDSYGESEQIFELPKKKMWILKLSKICLWTGEVLQHSIVKGKQMQHG